jgi:CxxC motif-containing protein (DUF1111 family)
MTRVKAGVASAIVPLVIVGALQVLRADFIAVDPGVRDDGIAGAGHRIAGLTATQRAFFANSRDEFEQVEEIEEGLGPRFNLDSCVGCHKQPASGGSSPAVNPQVAVANAFGAGNTVPSFIKLNGPVREARFKKNANGSADGGVHSLFTIGGRSDAPGCTANQENFEAQVMARNIIFRIPTPVFGAGLIEMIPDYQITANRRADRFSKQTFGIAGRENHNGNDGTIARFGWKAQNKSLLLFAGEAYNVEMGITNDNFQNERDEDPTCQFAGAPNNTLNPDAQPVTLPSGKVVTPDVLSAVEKFTIFMRFLAPPTPSATVPGGSGSIDAGRQVFSNVGCAYCHTPSFTTGASSFAALSNQQVNLFSDLLVHNMGPRLADDISQGQAAGDEFRTAPLWGLGKRIFFLHDGRTQDLREAIEAHAHGSVVNPNYPESEAHPSVDAFQALSEWDKQNLLNFLRSL